MPPRLTLGMTRDVPYPQTLISAFCVFSSNGTLLDSEGVSSLTVNGTGDYTVTYSVSFSSSSTQVATWHTSLGGAVAGSGARHGLHSLNAGSARLINFDSNAGAVQDPTFGYFTALGI